jgi:transcriptional regulator with XRE-family HTH domain
MHEISPQLLDARVESTACKTGITQGNLSRLRSGQQSPSYNTVIAAAKVFNRPANEILYYARMPLLPKGCEEILSKIKEHH